MKKIVFLLLIVLVMGCDRLQHLDGPNNVVPVELTEGEVIKGLKEALEFGVEDAVNILSAENGYYGDELVKILLPPDADIILENISKLPGGKQQVDRITLLINRSAEDAASQVASIFLKAIQEMTIEDGFAILNGDKNAATAYLKRKTKEELFQAYRPKIQESTEKKIVGGVSTAEAWRELTGNWNMIAGSFVGKASGLETVDVNLEDYLTNKALDGLFSKIEDQEGKIRKDPVARVTSLLQRVFGSR